MGLMSHPTGINAEYLDGKQAGREDVLQADRLQYRGLGQVEGGWSTEAQKGPLTLVFRLKKNPQLVFFFKFVHFQDIHTTNDLISTTIYILYSV
jgi:hypothetical protein